MPPPRRRIWRYIGPDVYKRQVVLHLVLHIKWKRHVKPVQPDLIGVNLLMPEISALRAGLGLQLAVNEIDSLPVLRLSGQVV